MRYYSSIKRNETTRFVDTRMGLEIIILSAVTREKYWMIALYVESKKKNHADELIYRTRRPIDIEGKLKVTGAGEMG